LQGGSFGDVAVADVNDDQRQDLLVVGSGTATLYLQNSDKTFEAADAGLTGGEAASIADVNGDDRKDLLITGRTANSAARATLYLQNSDGTFSEAGAGLTGVTAGHGSVGDVDGDGAQDLLVTGRSANAGPIATLYLQEDDGSFAETDAGLTGVEGSTTEIADIEGDGDADLLIGGNDALPTPSATRLYVNRTQQTPPNRVPTFVQDVPFAEQLAAGVTTARVVEAGDRDGDPLTISGSGPSLSVDDAGNGVAEGTLAPDRSQIGQTADLSITASDSDGATASRSQSVTVPEQVAAVQAGLPGTFGSATSVADVDGDGNQDLLVAGRTGTLQNSTKSATLYLQDDDGTFAPADAGLTGVEDAATAIGDVDNDGQKDLLVTGSSTATLYLQTDDGTFAPAGADLTGVEVGSASIADVNGDDAPDILITGRDEDFECTSALYPGNGDGTFTPADAGLTAVCESSASIADVDGNGTMDLLIAGQAETSSGSVPSTTLYLQTDDGTFAPANANLTGVSRGASSVGDVDENGNADLLVTGYAGDGLTNPRTTLYLQSDDGTFTEASAGLTNAASSATAIADMNGDGHEDLVVTGIVEGSFLDSDPAIDATLYLGGGDGTFAPAQAGLLGVWGGSGSVADVDGDADTDLLLTGVDEGASPTATLYENLGGGGSLPVASATNTITEDGTEDFGDTGTDLAFSGVSGSDAVTVNRYDEGPDGTNGISESNVSSYRVTIDAGSGAVRLTGPSRSSVQRAW
jgi:hypothetical protein